MNVRPDRASPFGISIWMTKPEMDSTCLDELRKSQRYLPSKPGPINIERFLESYLGVPIDYQNLGIGYLGCAVFSPKGKPIKVIVSDALLEDSKPTERRLRSTLAHEAGHCLFHPSLFMEGNPQSDLFDEDVDRKKGRILCRDAIASGENRMFKNQWWEYQANRAIGGLLLPKHLVEKCLEGILNVSMLGAKTLPLEQRDKAIAEVSEVFDVNPIVAKYRLEEFFPVDDQQLTL